MHQQVMVNDVERPSKWSDVNESMDYIYSLMITGFPYKASELAKVSGFSRAYTRRLLEWLVIDGAVECEHISTAGQVLMGCKLYQVIRNE